MVQLLEKIFGRTDTQKNYTKRSETITTRFRKRTVNLYAHTSRMNGTRLRKRNFNIISTSKLGTSLYKETKEDLQELNITEQDIRDRNT